MNWFFAVVLILAGASAFYAYNEFFDYFDLSGDSEFKIEQSEYGVPHAAPQEIAEWNGAV